MMMIEQGERHNSKIDNCEQIEDDLDEAEDLADDLEDILEDGLFRIESFVNSGVDTANAYAEFTIDFSNNGQVLAQNTVNNLVEDVEGEYEVDSEFEVFLELEFENDATFELLNNTWEVTSFSETTISMQSTANAAITLVLTQI